MDASSLTEKLTAATQTSGETPEQTINKTLPLIAVAVLSLILIR